MCENTYEKYAMEYQKTLDKNFNLDTIYRKDALHACFDGWNKGFEEIARDIRLLPSAQSKRMTTQEAIDVLQNSIVRFGRNCGKTVYAEALDMAIEALQRGLENVNADSCSEEPNRVDLISRSDAILAVHWSHTPDSAISAIKSLPSVQPEIIRCKDCKYRVPETKGCRNGAQWRAFPKRDDDYCSWAERKENE